MDDDAVATAIETLFSSTSGSPAVNNPLFLTLSNLYNTVAPPVDPISGKKLAYPYATFTFVGARPDWMMGGFNFEDVLIQFSLFSATGYSSKEIDGLIVKTAALFDEAPLSVSGYETIWMRRGVDHGKTFDEGLKVWFAAVDYSLYVKKS